MLIADRALSSYANLTKSLDQASGTEINTYRRWIAEHTPIADTEARFLDHKDDLLSIPPSHPRQSSALTSPRSAGSSSQHEVPASALPTCSTATTSKTSGTRTRQQQRRRDLETPVIVLWFALVSTTIVFHVVPYILARLVISLLMGVAALGILHPEALCSWEGMREWKGVIGGYIVVMGVLGVIVG